MKEVDYMAVAEKAMDQIKQGAFLTVRAGEALNTMTIGWAAIGHVWRRPVLMVLVRDSRHVKQESYQGHRRCCSAAACEGSSRRRGFCVGLEEPH